MTPIQAYLHALNVVKARCLEVEDIIKKDPYFSCQYARNIIKGRWIEGEDAIKQDTYASFFYAIDIIKKRFLEGEESIKEDPIYWIDYCYQFNIKKEKVNWKLGL